MSETRTNPNALAQSNVATAGKGKKAVKETSATLVTENLHRVELYVCNPSSKEVWLALGEAATKEEGIWLKKEGGSVVIPGWLGLVACITTEGEGSITYTEI